MLIKQLRNPLSREYIEYKNLIRSIYFPWFFGQNGEPNKQNTSFYWSHCILQRPENEHLTSKINSEHFTTTINILKQILEYNNLNINYFLRITVNTTIYFGGGPCVCPHHDHEFPHKNLLIYLNESSGETVVINSENNSEEYFSPKEDAIVVFEGEHYHYQPNPGQIRTVLVATFV